MSGLAHENADPKRVAVAGLSGGGWQTIFISSLDTRVSLCNPVAGYSSFRTRARYLSDLGDSEQTPVDLGMWTDYAIMTAMLAPRAALLTNNASDQCCFKAEHALLPLVQAARPVYRLLNAGPALRTHVNYDPGNHNFQLDNRQQLYRMLGDRFYGGYVTATLTFDADQLKGHGIERADLAKALPRGFAPQTNKLRWKAKLSMSDASKSLLDRTLQGANGARVKLSEVASLKVDGGHSRVKFDPQEIPSDAEVKTSEELHVELPENNADFNSLAKSLVDDLPKPLAVAAVEADPQQWKAAARKKLIELIRADEYFDDSRTQVQAIPNKTETVGGVTATWWWFRILGEWTVPAVELTPANPVGPTVLLVANKGRKSLAKEAGQLVEKGRRVIAFDPFYLGESKISKRDFLFALLVSAAGERPLGLQAGQISQLARWTRDEYGGDVEVIAYGSTCTLSALAATALEPNLITRCERHGEVTSLKDVIKVNMEVTGGPELFCFGLLEHFDIPQLIRLAGERRVRNLQ